MSKKFNFSIINVKLQSQLNGSSRTEAYTKFLTSVSKGQLLTRVNKNESVTLYTPYKRESNGLIYLYGTMAKGISFHDKPEIQVRDSNSKQIEATQKDKLFDYKTTEYLFIPSIHRIALLKGEPGSPNIKDLEKFLNHHLPSILGENEKLIIEIEKEPKIIEEIFKAQKVFALSYEISYTNSDALNPQGQLFDKKLKKAHIGTLKVVAESDHSSEGMDLSEDILGGGLDLAKKNGQIRSARILPINSEKVTTVSNIEKVKTLSFDMIKESDNKMLIFFKKLLDIYA